MNLFYLALVSSLLTGSFSYAQNTLPTTGNVGVGTTNPTTALDVRGIISVPEIAFRNADGTDDSDPYRLRKYRSAANQNYLELQLNDDFDESFRIYGNSCEGFNCGDYSQNLYHLFDVSGNAYHKGNLGIGTSDTHGFKLAVNGNIRAKEIKVEAGPWPDYVFKPAYHLPSLTTVKAYIDKNQHLPDMPSEAEVAKDGVNLGEMNKLLLKKVEELTLYLIEKDKQLKDMQLAVATIQLKINKSKKFISAK